MKAVMVRAHGGPEVLRYEDVDAPDPGPDDVLVAMQAIGVNFSDLQYRRGGYAGNLPLIPGHEGGGQIVHLGPNVSGFEVGDRVVFAGQHRRGTYKELMSVPAADLVRVPESVDMQLATAVLNQGRTAQYLVQDARPIVEGDRVLIHAGAGGVGSNLVQMAKRMGAYVYATVSSARKAEFARGLGADEVILYTETDFEKEIKERTDGRGVDVVFDAIGGDVLEKSLRCLVRRGHLVCYGQTGGQPAHLEWPQRGLGSIYLSYHTGPDYVRSDGTGAARAAQLFEWVEKGQLKVHIHREFRLEDAASAHREMENRDSIGKILLIP